MTDLPKTGVVDWANSPYHLGRHLSGLEWLKVNSGVSVGDSPKLLAVRAAIEREKEKKEGDPKEGNT
jgi:hypothetical protein